MSSQYTLIIPHRVDKAAPSTSQQINKFPPKRVKNLATPSSIFVFVLFFIHRRALLSANQRRRFLDPEYSFDEYFQLGSRRKVGPIKNQLASPNSWKSRRNIRPIKNGLYRWSRITSILSNYFVNFRRVDISHLVETMTYPRVMLSKN